MPSVIRKDGYRFWQTLQIAILHLFSGLAVGLILLDRKTLPGVDPILVMAGPVLSAGLLGAVLLFSFPRLLPAGKVAFPVNLTLPVVFTLLVRASVILWVSPQSAVYKPADPLMPALIWIRPAALIALIVTEVVGLTVWVALRRGW